MGLTKATKVVTTGPKGAPWHLPSGIYTATLRSVSVEKGEGSAYVYKLGFLPEYDKAPNPLDVPTVTAVLDSGTRDDVADLYAILGTPRAEGTGVRWGEDGLIRWNGDTGDSARFVGIVELTVETKLPKFRPARDQFPDGWFPASYTVKSVNPPGESATIALEAQLALVDQQTTIPGAVEPHTPPPPPKAKR